MLRQLCFLSFVPAFAVGCFSDGDVGANSGGNGGQAAASGGGGTGGNRTGGAGAGGSDDAGTASDAATGGFGAGGSGGLAGTAGVGAGGFGAGGAGAGGVGAGGSGGVAGTGGGGTCNPPQGSQICVTCLAQNCCVDYAACEGNAGCAAALTTFISCRGAGGGYECCDKLSQQGGALGQKLSNCCYAPSPCYGNCAP